MRQIHLVRILFFVLLFFVSIPGFSQNIDVEHYRFQIQLSDENNKINGIATIFVAFLQPAKEFSLNLIQQNGNGKGMKVNEVKGRNVAGFQQLDDHVIIQLKNSAASKSRDSFEIIYSGIPADGLIISKNRFGDRTFFSDNWPNRAQHWLPCNDVPSDKASVEFLVTAPVHYQVVSNGVQIEETNIDKTKKLTHWIEQTPISTKIMVIGVAQFAVIKTGDDNNIPVTAWVYPQNKENGVHDFAVASDILQFFTQYIGSYPFQKLANVQSTTMFGGMENASAIFYDERAVNGKGTIEGTVSHEIVHQWFGDMATEKSFAHLWLSEGFANYLTNIYLEQKYGRDKMNKSLIEEREKVTSFSRVKNIPVVDSVSELMDLLNANSYQKGSWILHMLRGEVGDVLFQKIVRQYYQQYKGNNADTRDFQLVAEKVSGKKLDWFFNQWLYQPGIPKINAQWKMQGTKVAVTVQQSGKNIFQFPLTIGYYAGDGKMQSKKINVTKASETFLLSGNIKPSKMILDPFIELLFEGTISESK